MGVPPANQKKTTLNKTKNKISCPYGQLIYIIIVIGS
ncbi:M60 family peptidase N-terminal accessory domain-containing protein [Bacillus mycoides]